MGKKQCIALLPGAVHRRAGQNGRINIGALEPFVPVPVVINDIFVEILTPQGRAAIDAQPVKTEGIQLEPGGEAKALQDVLFGFAGRSDQEEAMGSFDPVALGFTDGVFDLLQRLPLVKTVEDLCVPASTPNARKLQFALLMTLNWSTATESTRPSHPHLNCSLRRIIPWQMSLMRVRFIRK